jgi:hypothetical protein
MGKAWGIGWVGLDQDSALEAPFWDKRKLKWKKALMAKKAWRRCIARRHLRRPSTNSIVSPLLFSPHHP